MTPVGLYVLDHAASREAALTAIDPASAILTATELAATRGDGVFETIVVVRGIPQAVEAHLNRLARSAQLLDLPEPDREKWRAAIAAAADSLSHQPRAAVKLVLSRGDEAGDGGPTCWLLAFTPTAARTDPPAAIDVVTLDRGYRSDVAKTSPWLLQGAKTLSYAVNLAALREARRRGADDTIFLSSDLQVLEGPTSTVIARIGGVFVTPPTDLGILPGTTQQDAFTLLRASGQRVETRGLPLDELRAAEALWLCSSTRGAAPVKSLDGAEITVDVTTTTFLNSGLDARWE